MCECCLKIEVELHDTIIQFSEYGHQKFLNVKTKKLNGNEQIWLYDVVMMCSSCFVSIIS
jgi:hypothetical protein